MWIVAAGGEGGARCRETLQVGVGQAHRETPPRYGPLTGLLVLTEWVVGQGWPVKGDTKPACRSNRLARHYAEVRLQ